jgi:hypothetical protein
MIIDYETRETSANNESKNELGRFVAEQCLVGGHFSFDKRKIFTDTRIDPEAIYSRVDQWSQLTAEILLKTPTAGIVGMNYGERHWIQGITRALDQRGIYVPATEIGNSIEEVWGENLSSYQENPVTVITDVNLSGGTLDYLAKLLTEQGVYVNQSLALIDLNPTPMTHTPNEKIPFTSVLHFPLTLYGPNDEILYQEDDDSPVTLRKRGDIKTLSFLS